MDPDIGSILTVAGNAAVTLIIVQVVLGALKPSDEQRDRFGPVLALISGIVLALGAEIVISTTEVGGAVTAEGIYNAVLIGIVAGWTSMGIHDTANAASSQITGNKAL